MMRILTSDTYIIHKYLYLQFDRRSFDEKLQEEFQWVRCPALWVRTRKNSWWVIFDRDTLIFLTYTHLYCSITETNVSFCLRNGRSCVSVPEQEVTNPNDCVLGLHGVKGRKEYKAKLGSREWYYHRSHWHRDLARVRELLRQRLWSSSEKMERCLFWRQKFHLQQVISKMSIL